MLIDNAILDAALVEAKELGSLTDLFASTAIEVAKNLYFSNRFAGYSVQTKEEWLSEFSLILVRRWQKLEPGKNTRAYLYTMAGWASAECRRRYARRKAREIELLELASTWAPVLSTGDAP